MQRVLASIEKWVPRPSDNGDCPDIGGPCRFGKGQVCIADPVKSAPKPGTKRAVVDCATDLEQQIGARLDQRIC